MHGGYRGYIVVPNRFSSVGNARLPQATAIFRLEENALHRRQQLVAFVRIGGLSATRVTTKTEKRASHKKQSETYRGGKSNDEVSSKKMRYIECARRKAVWDDAGNYFPLRSKFMCFPTPYPSHLCARVFKKSILSLSLGPAEATTTTTTMFLHHHHHQSNQCRACSYVLGRHKVNASS